MNTTTAAEAIKAIAAKQAEYAAEVKQNNDTLVSQIQKYNDFIQNGDFKSASSLDEEIKATLKNINKASKLEYVAATLGKSEPMRAFIIDPFWTQTKTVLKELDDGTPVLTVAMAEQRFDITSLSVKVLDGITTNGAYHYLEAFCFAMTGDIAEGLGAQSKSYWDSEVNRLFKISDEAREIKLSVSNNQLRKTISKIVAVFLGDEAAEKVTSSDVRFLKESFANYDWKRDKLTLGSRKVTGMIFMRIFRRILTDGYYTFATKQMRKEEK